MKLSRLKWYAARLAAMSPPEILHRLREAALKNGWRGNLKGWANFEQIGDGPLSDLNGLRERLAAAGDIPGVGEALARFNAGDWTGLGKTIRAETADVFFKDPARGATWPRDTYCFDIDVRATGDVPATGMDRSDVKYVWEINRLQFLHPLTVSAAQGDRDSAGRLVKTLQEWHDANPPYRGVNWFSGIELAMRMVTLTLAIAALGPDMPAGTRIMLRRTIAAHGFWLHRYPSRYSSANNHLVAEGLGLFLCGLLVPDLPHAGAWLEEGRHILEAEAAAQIHADGVGAEQSPTYQAFTMEMLGLGALLAGMAGQPLASVVTERLRAGAFFLRTLMDANALPPRIGDDDEGRVIGQPPDREPRYVASIVAAVAGLVGDASLLPPVRDPHLRDVLFAVPAGTGTAADGVTCFADGGYSVVRQMVHDRAMVLTFDHGPLGYLSLAAHGHADALAVWLSLDDQPVFVDAGTFLYHSGGFTRNKLRSSAAHNTVTVCGQSQSIPSSAFSWSRTANATLIEASDGPEFHLSGRHDGYRSRFGVIHKRRIDAIEGGFLISDMLEGAAEPLEAKIGFLLHPRLDVRFEQGQVVVLKDEAMLLSLTPPQGADVQIEGGKSRHNPEYSAAFGVLEPTMQIVFALKIGAAVKSTRVRIHPPQ